MKYTIRKMFLVALLMLVLVMLMTAFIPAVQVDIPEITIGSIAVTVLIWGFIDVGKLLIKLLNSRMGANIRLRAGFWGYVAKLLAVLAIAVAALFEQFTLTMPPGVVAGSGVLGTLLTQFIVILTLLNGPSALHENTRRQVLSLRGSGDSTALMDRLNG